MDTQILADLEKWYRSGEFGRVVYTCSQALADPACAQMKPILLFWKGAAHDAAGRAWQGEAMSCWREGIALAGRDRPIKARLIAALGKIYGDSGDWKAYAEMMKEFERIARDGHPKVMYYGVWVWYNYGVALDNGFRWHEAAQAYAKAGDLAREHDVREYLWRSLHNLSGVHLYLGNLAEAAAAMAEADAILPDDGWAHKKLSRRAEYALAAGDLVSAQQWVTTALVHPGVDDFTRADVYYTWAATLDKLGRPGEAYEKALLALDHAVKTVHVAAMHRINVFLQQVSPKRRSS